MYTPSRNDAQDTAQDNVAPWAPLAGVTRLGTWPLYRTGPWTWRDAVMAVPCALGLVFIALPILAFVEWRAKRRGVQ